jgi:hypothetical protein
MTGKDKDRIKQAMVIISGGDKRGGLSILADMVKPSWRQDAITAMVSSANDKLPTKVAKKAGRPKGVTTKVRKPRTKKVKQVNKLVEGTENVTPVCSEPTFTVKLEPNTFYNDN